MGRKYEITEENIRGYVQHLEKKKAKYERDASKLKYHIDRIDEKIRTPEKSLRKDLAEGVIEASKAAGISLNKKVPAAPGPGQTPSVATSLGDQIEDVVKKMKTPEPDKKKSGWENW